MRTELLNCRKRAPDETTRHALTQGTLVRLSGIAKGLVKQDLKIAVMHVCEPAYVDYQKDAEACVVRFATPQGRAWFLEKHPDGTFPVKHAVCRIAALEGEEETAYFERVSNKRKMYKAKH
jgi:hypothetical protein